MSAQQLAVDRQNRLRALARAHAITADSLEKIYWKLGVPVVVLTTLVGTAAFANVADLGKTRVWIAVATGGLSIVAAVLAAVQTFFNFSGRAQKHAVVAAELSALDRRLDRALLSQNSQALIDEISLVDEEWDKLMKDAPRVNLEVQREAWNRAREDSLNGEVYAHVSPRDRDLNHF